LPGIRPFFPLYFPFFFPVASKQVEANDELVEKRHTAFPFFIEDLSESSTCPLPFFSLFHVEELQQSGGGV